MTEPLAEYERGITFKELQALRADATEAMQIVFVPDGRCFSKDGKRWFELDHDPTPAA